MVERVWAGPGKGEGPPARCRGNIGLDGSGIRGLVVGKMWAVIGRRCAICLVRGRGRFVASPCWIWCQTSGAAVGGADLRGEVTTVEIGGGGRRKLDATRFMLAVDVSEGAARWREEVVDMAAPSRLRARDFGPKRQSRAAVPCPHPSIHGRISHPFTLRRRRRLPLCHSG